MPRVKTSPDPGLVDHLLVELADPAAALLRVGAGEEDAEQAAVRDGAAGGDGEPLGARPAGDRAARPGPRPRAGAARRRRRTDSGPASMSSTAVNADSGSEAKGAARRTSASRSSTCQVSMRGHGDELLGQHVQGVGRDAQRLDGAARASAR